MTSANSSYHRSSPRFLYKIYDSLIHPLPIQLEYLMSPDKLEDDFLLASPINTESIASLITNPKVESNEMGLDQLLQMEKQTRWEARVYIVIMDESCSMLRTLHSCKSQYDVVVC